MHVLQHRRKRALVAGLALDDDLLGPAPLSLAVAKLAPASPRHDDRFGARDGGIRPVELVMFERIRDVPEERHVIDVRCPGLAQKEQMRLDRRAHCPKVGKRYRRCRVGEDEIGEVMQFDGGLAGGKHDGLPSLINPGADGLGGDEGCIRGREVAERGPDQRIKSIDYRLHQISAGPTTSTGQPKYEYTKSPLPWRSVNFARSLNRVPTLYKLGFVRSLLHQTCKCVGKGCPAIGRM